MRRRLRSRWPPRSTTRWIAHGRRSTPRPRAPSPIARASGDRAQRAAAGDERHRRRVGRGVDRRRHTAAAAAAPALSPAEAVTLAADAATTADALLDELSDAPSTLDDADSVLTAIGWAADARALADQAQTFLAADADPSLAPAGLTSAALASSSVQTARALADLRGEVEGAGGLASEADLDGLASLLRRAAVAATDAYDARRGDSPVASDDLNGLRTIAFEAARDELGTRADEGGAWLALGVANTAFARSPRRCRRCPRCGCPTVSIPRTPSPSASASPTNTRSARSTPSRRPGRPSRYCGAPSPMRRPPRHPLPCRAPRGCSRRRSYARGSWPSPVGCSARLTPLRSTSALRRGDVRAGCRCRGRSRRRCVRGSIRRR